MKDFDPVAYSDAAARAIGLTLPEQCKPGVAANLARLAAMAESLFSFALVPPDSRDAAP